MRYMNWSYDQLMACPEDYLQVISDVARRESAEARVAARARRERG